MGEKQEWKKEGCTLKLITKKTSAGGFYSRRFDFSYQEMSAEKKHGTHVLSTESLWTFVLSTSKFESDWRLL